MNFPGIRNKKPAIWTISMFMAGILLASSCNKFLEVEPPNSQVPTAMVFDNDVNANSAVVGAYLDMYKGAFASGGTGSLSWVAGLTADELHNNPQIDQSIIELEQNEIQSENTYIADLWSAMYKPIYQANAIIEGLNSSASITPAKKSQFNGEALFIRAFCYFYLINIFGDVPLVLTTDYQVNAKLGRNTQTEIYNQVEADLSAAENLLPENYPTEYRVRPNKSTAVALLSRVHLYRRNWAAAAENATKIISHVVPSYELLTDLNTEFLATSKGAIWQLKPNDLINYTNEGYVFLFQGPNSNGLSDTIVKSFDDADKRLINWVTKIGNLYFPYKYKLAGPNNSSNKEYSVALRLAEQYLIRAEARAQQGNISGTNGALADINIIRSRAGLEDTTANNLPEIMGIIERERKLELLSEWAHRWLDLKRWNRSTEVLSPFKSRWSPNDTIFPVPQIEINKNPQLKPQNPGYR